MRARKEEKISIEGYLQFFLSQKQSPLSACLLNQIISIHGFKKIHGIPKKVLIEAVDKIDLETLSRSTLKEENQTSLSCALMSMEDIMADLKELDWQECCVSSSIKTLKASSSPASNLQAAATTSQKKKKKKKNRVNSTADALSQPPVAAATTSKKKRKRGSNSAHELSLPPASDTASCASLA